MKKILCSCSFLFIALFLFTQNHLLLQIDSLEIPLCSASSDHEIRSFMNYTLCYRESYEQCEWAAYELTVQELEKKTERINTFKIDPLISTGSAALEDYRSSQYDRGHMAPAADFLFDEEAMKETFFMSNMSPQDPSMNRGIWSRLEDEGRKLAKKYGRVFIITGPVLEKNTYKTIGINKVSVPEFFYKIFLSPVILEDGSYAVSVSAYCIPNSKTEKKFIDYECTVNELEKRCALDFFFKLDDELEEKIESSLSAVISIK